MSTRAALCPKELSWATFQLKVPPGKNNGIAQEIPRGVAMAAAREAGQIELAANRCYCAALGCHLWAVPARD
jgi:hypothetical protein